MQVTAIKNIIRKDVPIYYRRSFSGILEIELFSDIIEKKIEFTIETRPFGSNEISINFLETIEYPLIPLKNAVRKFISELDETGGLPI